MKAATLLCTGCCLALASSASATIWVDEFTNFTGTNSSSVSNYTDTLGGNPNTFAIAGFTDQTGSIVQASPWLQQGDLGGGNKTAKFNNEPGNGGGRARFGTYLPTSMDLNEGIAVAWRMRTSTVNTQRGAIQIAASGTGAVDAGTSFNAFINIRNTGGPGGNSTIDIQRNGGGFYAGLGSPNAVSQYVLGSNIANEYHQWTAAIIRRPSDNRAYWKLWLDGTLLLFGGVAGSPMVDPDDGGPLGAQQFSFSTFSEANFQGGSDASMLNRPYIGLGELVSTAADPWDFEFDFVNYRDDGIAFFVPEPASLLLLAAGGLLLSRRRPG